MRSDSATTAKACRKFGTVNATRRVNPCSASKVSTWPCGSPETETTKCSAEQYFSNVNGLPKRWPMRLTPVDLAHAEHHRDIVKRFGRFPHRNKILGRTMT